MRPAASPTSLPASITHVASANAQHAFGGGAVFESFASSESAVAFKQAVKQHICDRDGILVSSAGANVFPEDVTEDMEASGKSSLYPAR